MFLVAVGACLPLLLGVLPPAAATILYGLVAIELTVEAFRPVRREAAETLGTPTKTVALLLIAGGAIALLKTWPEPIRRSATLLLLSGACLLWGYRHGRTEGPWILTGPSVLATLLTVFAYARGWAWADRLIGPAWLAWVTLLPAALIWGLIVAHRPLAVCAWFVLGVLYLLALFLLANWMAIAAYVFVVVLALAAVRQDPDVPLFPTGVGLGVWFGACFFALIPAAPTIGLFSGRITSAGARVLLSGQSLVERTVGSYTWERLWSVPRQVPLIPSSSVQPWWREYLGALITNLGWLVVVLAVALLISLFLICTSSRRPRDRSHPALWRFLGIGAWLVVAAPTSLWLMSPLLWLLVGGVLGLKEATSEPETAPHEQAISRSAAILPAVMAALVVVPLIQSGREWRAEHLVAGLDRPESAARWAPWRADIVQEALREQLKLPPLQRDSVTIRYLLAWLIRSNHKREAYEAEASLSVAGGGPAVASLAAAVQISPRDLEIRRRYADALKTSGLLEEARRQYEACADLSPLDPSLRIAIGSLWELLHREDLALHEYRKALLLDPQSAIARFKVTELSRRAAQ